MENPIKMDDLGGKPTIFGNIHFPNKKNTFFFFLFFVVVGVIFGSPIIGISV